MKKILLYKLTIIFLSFTLTNCEDEDKLRVNFDEVEASSGVFAQLLSQNGETDVIYDNPSVTSFERAYQIISPPGKFEIREVRFYASFTDNTIEEGGMDISAAEQLIKTISTFDNSQQYPQFTVSFTGDEIVNPFGLVIGDIDGGDTFNYRTEIVTTDDQTFTDVSANFDNQSADHTFTSNVICVVTPTFFTGTYLMEQLSGADPFYASEVFGDTQIVEITANGTLRSFNFLYFPGIFDSDYNFTMNLSCGDILVTGSINAGGLGCGGANIGFATGNPISTYDEDLGDDIMLVNLNDFEPDGNCATGSYPVEVRFTKQ